MKIIRTYLQHINEQVEKPTLSITLSQKKQMESQAEELIRNYTDKLNEFSLLIQRDNADYSEQKIKKMKKQIMDLFNDQKLYFYDDLVKTSEKNAKLPINVQVNNIPDYIDKFCVMFGKNIIKREITGFEPGYIFENSEIGIVNCKVANGFLLVSESKEPNSDMDKINKDDDKLITGKIENNLEFSIIYKNGIPKIHAISKFDGEYPNETEIKVEG